MNKKTQFAFAFGLISVLTFGVFLNTNIKKELKPGDFDPRVNSYFYEKIDDPFGFTKAHKFVTPTDNYYSSQKTRSHSVSLLGDLESTWDSYTGKGTKIAIIDDGFDIDHPEYIRSDGTSAISSASRNFYSANPNYYESAVYYDEYSSNPSCIAEDWEETEWDANENPTEWGWATHGTNTSTTAAAPMNNGGGVGIAPDAEILALKIDFSFSAIRSAIRYAINCGVDVINMSLGAYAETFDDGFGEEQLGGSQTATFLNAACQEAYDAGIIVVAAAGNEATYHKSYPACNSHVIGVGALYKNDANTLAPFTNYVGSSQTGEINVDILAPGYVYTAHQIVTNESQIYSSSEPSSHKHGYDDTQGTSFASPIVAGAACLWKQKYPNGTPSEFLSQLQSTASGIGDYSSKYVPVRTYYGNSYSNQGPSNIAQGRLNVSNLLDINSPYIRIAQSSIDITVGENKQVNLDTYNGTISYSIADTSVATVSNTGLVTGVASGSTTLTVIATKGSNTDSVTIPVTVSPLVACQSISISPDETTISVGEEYAIEPTITTVPSNASRIFLFASEDDSIATVDEDTGLVTGVSEGDTTIQIVAINGDGYAELSVHVSGVQTYVWSKVNSISGISSGDEFTFGSYAKGVVSGTLSGSYLPAIEATFDSESQISTLPSGAETFTLGTSGNSYTFTQKSNGNLLGYNAKNLTDGSGTTTWSMSISSGTPTITGGSYLFAFNSDSPRWKTYDSNYSSGAYAIYKKVSSSSISTVTSVTVSPSTLSLDVYNNKTSTLSATVVGTNSPAQTVNWSTDNANVATVSSSGLVTAVGAGSTTITATSIVNQSKSGTCTVTVTDSTPVTLSSISVATAPTKVSYAVDDYFDPTGLVITRHYSNSTSDTYAYAGHTSEFTFSPSLTTHLTTSNTSVTITYGGKSCSQAITVTSSGSSESFNITFKTGSGDGTTMSTSTSETNYLSSGGEYISSIASASSTYYAGSSGLKLGASSSQGSLTLNLESAYQVEVETIVVNAKLYNSSKAATLSVNSKTAQSVSSNFSDLTYDINDTITSISLVSSKYIWVSGITVNVANIPEDKIIGSLTASYSGSSIYVGGSLDESKVSVTANFTNSTKYPSAALSSSNYSLSGFSSATAGTSTVTVTYTGSIPTSTTPMTTTFDVTIVADNIKSISVTSNKTTAHPGETISKSNITLTATYDSGKQETKTDFTFETYQFTYNDAPSGGSSANKQFTVNYAGKSATFTVAVSRTAYVAPSTSTLTLTGTQGKTAGITGTGASTAADYSSISINGVTCAATNIYIYTVSSVNYFSFGTGTGEIHNTAALNKSISAISLDYRSGTSTRKDEKIYVSKTGTDNSWVLIGSADLVNDEYRYFKIAYESTSSNYSNFNNIKLTLKDADTPTNVANYIMYEDTLNQCETKFESAITKLNSMSSSDKSTFMTSNDYVIATARDRLEHWANHFGKTINLTNGNIVASSNTSIPGIIINESSNDGTIILIAVIMTTCLAGFTLICIKHKKHQ